MKKILMFPTALLISLALMGCNTNKEETNNGDKNGTGDNAVEENNGDVADEGTDTNTDGNLEIAEEAANQVAELDEVESATVIVTDRNAYAAVVLNNNTAGDNAEDEANANGDAGTDTGTDTGTNADAGSGAEEDENLTAELEEKIAEKVREADENIENVYVSLNPDFVERMTGYGEQINAGEPVEGLFEEFTESVRRVFPDAN